MGAEPAPSSTDDLAGLAAQAYIYGFPLVFNLQEVSRLEREGIGALPASPFNAFSHASTLAGPEDTFVSINNDTVYSIANIDAGAGPVRMAVPDAQGRYYVLQFVDAWTNNFAYVGQRATGTAAGSYLLVPPGWSGSAEGETVIHLPTRIATIVGRWAVDGEADLPAVRALQRGLTLEPSGEAAGLPEPDGDVADELRFFEQLRVGMRALAPAERDLAVEQRFAPLGLLEAESPYRDAGSPLAAALRSGQAAARAMMEQALTGNAGPTQNGWSLTYHVFDYNLDFFEVGTINEPAWKLADGPARYMQRALAARAGLWGNHGYEAAYAMVYLDGDGEQLDGSRRYELRFPKDPPVHAFWSVTMYDMPDFYLVENPIRRYSIGDRTEGLQRDPDGGLTICLQHQEPAEPERRANWLPTPMGAFRPILRMYRPEGSVFDGGYELPPITRLP